MILGYNNSYPQFTGNKLYNRNTTHSGFGVWPFKSWVAGKAVELWLAWTDGMRDSGGPFGPHG